MGQRAEWHSLLYSPNPAPIFFKMAETEEKDQPVLEEEGDEEEPSLNYKPPAEKSINEILKTDEDDASLANYKKKLLGDAAEESNVIVFPENNSRVVLEALKLKIDSRKDVVVSLRGDLSKISKTPFIIKEGCKYRMEIEFYVQREIVSGLKYQQSIYRKNIRVDKGSYMVGSYAPSKDLISYKTPVEDAPSGMLARGSYMVNSKFVDDDNHEYLKWEWAFEIKKTWD